MRELQNENVYVKYNENDKSIFFRDKKDVYNDFSGFTTLKRNVPKAWEFIQVLFNQNDLKDGINFREIRDILDDKFKLKVHCYCAMD